MENANKSIFNCYFNINDNLCISNSIKLVTKLTKLQRIIYSTCKIPAQNLILKYRQKWQKLFYYEENIQSKRGFTKWRNTRKINIIQISWLPSNKQTWYRQQNQDEKMPSHMLNYDITCYSMQMRNLGVYGNIKGP